MTLSPVGPQEPVYRKYADMSVAPCNQRIYAHELQELFPLPKMAGLLNAIKNELLNGKGFILFKNFPVNEWGLEKSAVAYLGIGSYLGYFVSQNSRGHVLGHVKDLGEDSTAIDKVRIYRTNAR